MATNPIHLTEKTDAKGFLRVDLPLGRPEAEVDIVVTFRDGESDDPDWPVGYFEEVPGSITDPTFERGPQGEYEKRLEF